jgi:hypothetical protein
MSLYKEALRLQILLILIIALNVCTGRAQNNVPSATAMHQHVAFSSAPLLQYSNEQPPLVYPYHPLQAQACKYI